MAHSRPPDPARSAGVGAPRAAYARGLLRTLPFLLVLIPFALLFGVVATAAGFDLLQTMGFSVLVLAGASQFNAVQLLSDHAPVLLIVASSLAINLRMGMYSASLVPWIGAARPWHKAAIAYLLIDQSFGVSIQQFEAEPQMTVAERVGFFMGTATATSVPWMIFTLVGATAGNLIPADWPLDFAVPITFLAMIAPMLRSPSHLAACLTAVVASLLLSGLPSGAGVLIAGPLGMVVGALAERRIERARTAGISLGRRTVS